MTFESNIHLHGHSLEYSMQWTCQLHMSAHCNHIFASYTTVGPPFWLRLPIWKSFLCPGKVKAYNEALKFMFIHQDSMNLQAELKQMTMAYEVERAKEEPSLDLLEHYEEKIWILEMQSEINLPEICIAFKLGKCMCPHPILAHGSHTPTADPFWQPMYRTWPSKNGVKMTCLTY